MSKKKIINAFEGNDENQMRENLNLHNKLLVQIDELKMQVKDLKLDDKTDIVMKQKIEKQLNDLILQLNSFIPNQSDDNDSSTKAD